MSRSLLSRLLLLPSLLSGLFVIITVSCMLGIMAWTYISHQQLFYEYLFGRYGLTTILLIAPDSFSAVRMALINGSLTYYSVVFVAAISATLVTYTILETGQRMTRGTWTLWRELNEDTKLSREILRQTIMRLIIRVISLFGWMAYFIAFIDVLLPASIVLLQIGISMIAANQSLGWGYVLVAWLLLAVTVHMHVTFARLTFLRPRLFGGQEIEVS
jgi:hypothetical protein